MKKFILILFSLYSVLSTVSAQQGWWTWMKGDNVANSSGNFGTQGVSDPANIPRALYSYAGWNDLQGNFWIFGGGNGSFYSDFWKYDPLINEWTWMGGTGLSGQSGDYGTKGIPSPTNYPGARTYGARSWTDDAGYLWLCGGSGYDDAGNFGDLNDLWRYDISTNEWTWMHGAKTIAGSGGVYGTIQVPDPNNRPGGRHEATACWKDVNGNLWFYGGYNYSQAFNDMWKYDPSTNEWAWMHGSSGAQNPDYGVKGVPSPSNTPGSRLAYSSFTDTTGNFWMFGGADYSIASFADLWRYDPLTNEWTWMSGSNALTAPGSAGALCDTSVTYYPESRFENRCHWADHCNHYWLTGGTPDFFNSSHNDLWVFDPVSLEWAYVNGSLNTNAPIVTGTQGVADPGNNPGGLICAIGFTDNSNNLFLMGGATAGINNAYNNLWKFSIDTTCPALNYSCISFGSAIGAFASDTTLCEKFCINYFDSSQNNAVAWEWIFEGGDPATSFDQNPTNICYDNPGVYDVTLITTDAGGGTDTLTLADYITVYINPFAPIITQTGNTLTSTPADSYQWQLNSIDIPGATNQNYEIAQSGLYTVIVYDENGCSAQSDIKATLVGIEEILLSGVGIYPNPTSGILTVECLLAGQTGLNACPAVCGGFMACEISISILNTLGQRVYSTIEEISSYTLNKEINLSDQPSAVYFLQLKSDHFSLQQKIIISK